MSCQEVRLGGWQLAAGSEVWVDVFAMHRSPHLWSDPHRFNPERWASAAATAPGASTQTEASSQGPLHYDGLHTVEREPDADGGDDANVDAVKAPESPAPTPLATTTTTTNGDVTTTPAGGGDSGEKKAPPLCNPKAFMPFGVGPRCCLGQGLALAEVKAAVAVLLCFLSFEPSGKEAPVGLAAATGAGEVAQLGLGLFLRPVGGLHLLVAPRNRRT